MKKDLNDYISSSNLYIEKRRELAISKKELDKKDISSKFHFGYSYKKVFNKHWGFDIENGIKEIS